MGKPTGIGREGSERSSSETVSAAPDVELWFIREILPLESILMQFLKHNWHEKSDIEDLRQEVYVRVCEAAHREIPAAAKPFVLTTARNLLVDRIRQKQIVPIDAVADLETLNIAIVEPGPEQTVLARDDLRRLQAALDRLPPRCREAMILGRIEGLTGREIASRMGISEKTVSMHLTIGMSAIADALYAESVGMKL
jgi:RNA polymerase sigma factor (sigma-70 family)